MADPRPSGKRGRAPARHMHELSLSRFRAFQAAAVDPPAVGDVSAGITDWGMLGNDSESDCVPAAVEHYRMAKAAKAQIAIAGKEIAADDGEADRYTVNLYRAHLAAQGETDDSSGGPGVVISDYLQWGYALGLWAGFAQVDPRNPAQLHQDMLDFHGVILGVTLADDAETRFENHQPWDVTPAEQPDPDMGHGILLVAYDQAGETVVTWGATQRATFAFEAGAVEEAWVLISAEDAERIGVDLAALQAEIQRTAQNGPADVPAAGPQPVPVVDPGTNSPRGDDGHTHSSLTARVESLFDAAHAEARAVLERARLQVHGVLVDALGPIAAAPDETAGS